MAVFYETPVVTEEYTSAVTQSGSTVTFTGLNPNFGYEIHYVSPNSQTGNLSIPRWTNVNKSISGSNMTLVYTISGGTSGSSQFRLKKTAV